MSNLLYAKSFGNQSGLTVDSINTKTINNIIYNTNVSDVSGYITNLYSIVSTQNNYANTLSGAILNINSTLSNQYNYLNSLSGSIININSSLISQNNYANTLSGAILNINSILSNNYNYLNSLSGSVLNVNSILSNNYNYLNSLSGNITTINSTLSNQYNYLNSLSGAIKLINSGTNAITASGAIFINPAGGISTLNMGSYLVKKEANDDVSVSMSGTTTMNWYINNAIRMSLTGGNFQVYNGAIFINQAGGSSTINIDSFYIRKETTNNVAFFMAGDNTYYWKTNNGTTRMTLDGGNLIVNAPISNGSNTLSCGNITCNTGAITISPSSGISSLYMDNFYIRKEVSGDVIFFTNSDRLIYFYTNSIQRMNLSSIALTLSVPINAASNSVTCGNINCGAITSGGSFTCNSSLSIPSGGVSTLYMENFYIRRAGAGDVEFVNTADKTMQFKINNSEKMNLSSSALNISVPINCGNITSTGLITNSIISSGTNGPLVIDPNYTTNNYVQIYDKLVVNGEINSTGIVRFGSMLYLNSNGNNAYFQMTDYGHCHMVMPSSGNTFNMNCNLWVISFAVVSDDRIKTNESLITDATTTILKLRPEIYDKYSNFDLSGNFTRESGFVIQEIWNIPELKHLVHVPHDANIEELETIQSTDPNNDPNYNPNWGTTAGALNYNGLLAYIVKGFQEQQTLIESLNNRIHILENP